MSPKRTEGRPWSSPDEAEAQALARFGPEAWAIVRQTWSLLHDARSDRDLETAAIDLDRLRVIVGEARGLAERHGAGDLLEGVSSPSLAELEAKVAEACEIAQEALADGVRSFGDHVKAALARELVRRRGRGGASRPGRTALLRMALEYPEVRRATFPPRGANAIAWAYAGIALGLDRPIVGSDIGPDREPRDERTRFYGARVNES